MGEVLGIDLGTTNTVVAGQLHGEVTALADPSGETLLPSVVSFHPNGSVLVGLPAKERRLIDPRNTVYSIKRLLGRRWDSKEVRQGRTRLPFELREGTGHAPVVAVRSGTYALPEISAFVLRKARKIAEATLGASAERAVITVPANFNDLQRAATKIAGRVAGLEILRIINEPTAAALAYGYGQRPANRLAVYDLGGGTFDITLLDLTGNQFEVLATAGNTFLGGDDFDRAIADRIAEAFLRAHRYDLRANHDSYARLRVAAETVKIRLSEQKAVSLPLPELAEGASGTRADFTFDFTRDELEETCADIVDQSMKVCREALTIARMRPSDFDEVLLVGGSTRTPFVRQRVAEFFGREPIWHINPEEVVAIGAGLQAVEMTRAQNRRSVPPPPPSQRKPSAPPLPAAPSPSGPAQPNDLMDADEMEEPTRIHPRSLLSTRPPPPSQRPPAPPPHRPAMGGHTVSGLGPTDPGSAGTDPGARGMTATEAALRARIAEENARFESELPSPGSDYPTGADPQSASAHSLPAFGVTGFEPAPEPAGPVAAPPALPLVGATALGLGTAPFATDPRDPGAGRPLPPSAHDRTHAGDSAVSDPPGATARGAHSQPPPAVDAQSLPLPSVPSSAPPLRPPGASPGAALPPAGSPLTSVVSAQISEALQHTSTAASAAGMSGTASAPVVLTGASAAVVPTIPAALAAPRLVDVTPLSLVVETVGGFCDAIIKRNTPVPCEQSRVFVTAADGQTAVRVRVGQGVSPKFGENALLGEVVLDSLRPAPRGQVQVEITFSLNTDGMLSVSAVDVATQHATTARLRLEGLPDATEIARLQQRQAALPTV